MVASPVIIRPESWSKAARSYDAIAVKVTYPAAAAAAEVVNKMLPFNDPTTYILDNGAGSGALTIEVSKRYPSNPILATDISPEMLSSLDAVGLRNVKTKQLDAMKLQSTLSYDPKVSKHGGFSHTFGMFMIHFVPNPDECLRQMVAVTRPGGTVCLGVWGKKQGMVEMLHQTLADFDPTYDPTGLFDGMEHFPQTEDSLRDKFEAFGLRHVQTKTIFHRPDKDDIMTFVNYFFNGRNPAVGRLLDDWNAAHPEIGIAPIQQRMIRRVKQSMESDSSLLNMESVSVMGIVE